MSYVKQCPICTCILFGRVIIADPETGDSKHVSKCENGHIVIQEVDFQNEEELQDRLEDLKRKIHENPEEGTNDSPEEFDQNI